MCVCMCMYEVCTCVLIHVLACVGMPPEITIYLSADHIRAEEFGRSIREVVQKNYASSDYITLNYYKFSAAQTLLLILRWWYLLLEDAWLCNEGELTSHIAFRRLNGCLNLTEKAKGM